MKKVGVIPNVKKDKDMVFTKQVVEWLKDKGLDPITTELKSKDKKVSNYVLSCEEVYKYSDFIVALGGDGTILTVARTAAKLGTPILGINLGTLGFLTDTDKESAFDSLRKVIDGNYKIDKRMMLQCSIERAQKSSGSILALNDFAVTKGLGAKIITYELSINGQYIHTYRADGVVVASPTGSTAYSLSAGGPVLKPDASMIAITPVSPHMLFARPSVVSGDDEIKITNISKQPINDTIFMIDGQNALTLKYNDAIVIKKADYYTNIIKTNDIGYYDILHQKMINIMK